MQVNPFSSIGRLGRAPRSGLLRIATVATLFLAAILVAGPTLATDGSDWLAGFALSPEPHPSVRVAFVRQGDVWVLDAVTGKETRLTNDGHGRLLGWTTGGGSLFFTSEPPGNPGQTLRWRPGHGSTIISDGLWSPDGLAVALTMAAQGRQHATVVWIEKNGHRIQITPDEPGFRWVPLSWTPDGQALALGRFGVPAGPGALWVTEGDVSAGHLRQLPLPPPAWGAAGWPDVAVWSPVGRYLAVGVGPDQSCVSCRVDGVPYDAIPVDGGNPVPLGSALDPGEALSWAPNASFVVLSENVGQGAAGRETYANKQLVRVDLPSGTRRDLSRDARWADVEPAVSPDGSTIAFVRGRNEQPWTSATAPGPGNSIAELIASRRIWLMRADGADKRQLADSPGWTDEAPVWTTDGRWIVFVRWRAKPTASAELWAVRPDGSGLQRLVAGLDHSSFHEGFGYYGKFGWRTLFAVAPR